MCPFILRYVCIVPVLCLILMIAALGRAHGLLCCVDRPAIARPCYKIGSQSCLALPWVAFITDGVAELSFCVAALSKTGLCQGELQEVVGPLQQYLPADLTSPRKAGCLIAGVEVGILFCRIYAHLLGLTSHGAWPGGGRRVCFLHHQGDILHIWCAGESPCVSTSCAHCMLPLQSPQVAPRRNVSRPN